MSLVPETPWQLALWVSLLGAADVGALRSGLNSAAFALPTR